jgi:hypothetical protein
MANYILVDRQSNLIVNVVSSSANLASTRKLKAIKAGDLTLDQYYKLQTKARALGQLVDAGALAKLSSNFKELLSRK